MMVNLIDDGTLWPIDEKAIGELQHILRHGNHAPGQNMQCAWILRSYLNLISDDIFSTETAVKKLRMIRRSIRKNK